jgi:hypothetical protein
MATGVLARAALISSIYKRGLTLTPKARTKHSNANLLNHVSTDVGDITVPPRESLLTFEDRLAELVRTRL